MSKIRPDLEKEFKRIKRRLEIEKIPYGFVLADDGLHLEALPHEQEGIALMVLLRKKGMAFTEIGHHLESLGYYLPKTAARWSPASIKGILARIGKYGSTASEAESN